MEKKNCLYIVATPIGHPADITLRALKVLTQADAIICEELRQGSKLLKKLEIPQKELLSINEHNEKDSASQVIIRLAQKQTLALISDCGTPVFSDPGHYIIRQVAAAGFPVIPIPGPSSLMAALSILDFKLEQFVFGGFIPQKSEARLRELQKLQAFNLPVILMDTPYRLGKLLSEAISVFGPGRRATLACDITLSTENIFRGSLAEIEKRVAGRKAEFILVIHEPQKRNS